MKALRVGVFVHQFPSPSETFIVTKVLGMLDAGIDVQVFAREESAHWDRFQVLSGRPDVRARVHCLPPLRPFRKLVSVGGKQLLHAITRHPEELLPYARHNWKTRKENSLGFLRGMILRLPFLGWAPDILHIEFDMQGIGIADLKDFLHCQLLVSARGAIQITDAPLRFPQIHDYLFRYADGYHFISNYLDKNTHRLGLSADKPSWLIRPAIDLDLFAPGVRVERAHTEPLQVISVGRLSWEKGYEFALDAIARVRAAGVPVRYRILGEGSYKEAIRFGAAQLGLGDDVVELLGAVPRERVPGYYQESDVMLHAALQEGFCNAVIEAQAMELPIVTTDAGGLPENVLDGVTGFVVPRRDPQAMADKLLELARNPALAERMGKAGRVRSLATFDLRDQVAEFVALYREMAAGTAA